MKTAEEVDGYDFRINFQINRAYGHFGQLPGRLFNCPRVLGVYALFDDNSIINGSLIMPSSPSSPRGVVLNGCPAHGRRRCRRMFFRKKIPGFTAFS